jgi:replication factor C subunit 3/5
MSRPWVEKYRPDKFGDILMTAQNRHIFTKMLERNHIPNMLLYGPPGTGKTTTVLNLIAEYQRRNGQQNKGLVLQLNASDDRGIDTIRTQINSFVGTKTFWGGTKFVIFDEVDYMTKPAQHALSYIMGSNVCMCLICNYISKIDSLLQDQFIKIKFNHLPDEAVVGLLKGIASAERLTLSDAQVLSIKHFFGSDVRSMINYLQTNQSEVKCVLTTAVWDAFYERVKEKENINNLKSTLDEYCREYCMDSMTLINDFMYYVLTTKDVPVEVITEMQLAFHNDADPDHLIIYVLLLLLEK